MKSNICVIERGGLGLENVLSEVEKVTDYSGMQKKEALRLRLLAEELVGMLSELVKNFEGRFWIQNNENKYLYISISDVRFWQNEWYNRILIRTAKSEKDYHGGGNNHTTLPELVEKAKYLFHFA